MDPDPNRDTGMTCVGVGMHCPSAASLFWFFVAVVAVCCY